MDGLFVQVDVTDEAAVAALFDAAVGAYGGIDISFHNAGISPTDDDSILDTPLDVWRRVQEVNLTSVYLCCRHVIPHMQRRGGGSIINTASFVAVMGAATSQISYTASKGGVLSMSRELGVQFARQGIRVNALCPGPVNTPMLQELFAKGPGARRPAARAHPDGALRRGDGDRRRGGVPGQRRRLVHHGLDVPRRRRHLRRLRHPVVKFALSLPNAGPPDRLVAIAAAADRYARETETLGQRNLGMTSVPMSSMVCITDSWEIL